MEHVSNSTSIPATKKKTTAFLMHFMLRKNQSKIDSAGNWVGITSKEGNQVGYDTTLKVEAILMKKGGLKFTTK